MQANRIYFAQHGLAMDKADDPERPLSKTGIQQSRKIAESLHRSETSISNIYHSGKLRAAQTADIFASTLGISTTSMIDGLSPNEDVALLAQRLTINDALYVGHLPHLDKLVAYLVTGEQNNSIIKFQNSAIVCLEKYNETRYLISRYLTSDIFVRSPTE